MIKSILGFAKKHLFLISLLMLVLLLRIPNFFEPYWYGDEAIYLTVGTGIRNGLKLYTDIIDHKTPIIYYLATTPTQLQFRILNVLWMLATTSLFYLFAKNIFKNKISTYLASVFFIILTTLPMLEGNIPNGELFVMGFVMVGAYLLSKTSFFRSFIDGDRKAKSIKNEGLFIFISGFFLGLGILTKVPGLFDLFAFMAIGWFAFFNSNQKLLSFKEFFSRTFILFIGAIFPIILSIFYYISVGSGKDYLDYGLLYNFRYSGSWKPNFDSAIIEKLFTLPGKAGIVAILILILTFLKKFFTPRFQFISAWLILTLFASILSNRPYPHYILQIIPAIALMIGHFTSQLLPIKSKIRIKYFEWLFSLLLIIIIIFIVKILSFSTYPTVSYYERFYKLATSQISKEKYDQSFNWLIKENYEIAELIERLEIKEMFIWGTNPILYAQTQTIPTSRFTVSFHIKDFDDYDRTFEQIENDMPPLIIMMKNEQTKFEALENLLKEKYELTYQYPSMDLYLIK